MSYLLFLGRASLAMEVKDRQDLLKSPKEPVVRMTNMLCHLKLMYSICKEQLSRDNELIRISKLVHC